MTNNQARYRGRTPMDAMRKATAELGPDTHLVSARRISGTKATPLYEILVEDHGDTARDDEIATLRQELEQLRGAQPEADADDFPLDRFRALLRRRGIREQHAEQLLQKAHESAQHDSGTVPFQALQRSLASALPRTADEEPLGLRDTLIVGPTGAGKTTLVARIAASIVARRRRCTLVCADGESLAGEDTLRHIGNALHLPVATAFFPGRLESLAQERDPEEVLLVDTPGRSPYEAEGIEGFRRLLDPLEDPEILLVLPAAMDAEEARDLLQGFLALGKLRIVFTKLDELAAPGRLIDVARAVAHPVACVTFGRSLRGTSSTPTDPQVIERILGTEALFDASI